MKPELYWLTLTVLMTSVLWVPYILNAFFVRGIMETMGNPSANQRPLSAWASRAKMAHHNAVENLVLFAPLVLLVQFNPGQNTLAPTAAMIYFWARLGHYIVYTLGIPVLRTIAFTIGFGCQITLALNILNAIN